MKKNNTAIMIIGLYNQERLELCTKSVKRIYGDTIDIYYGCHCLWDVEKQTKIEEFALSEGTEYLEVRQDFLPHDSVFICEAVVMFSMAKWLYDKGYEEVYIIHNDTIIWRDVFSEFREKMVGEWSYVSLLIPCHNARQKISKEEFLQYERPSHLYGSIEFASQDNCNNWRISIFFIIFNKKFIYSMYDKYGDEENMYNLLFKELHMCGDLSLLELIEDCNGFSGEVIDSDRNLYQDISFFYEKPFVYELYENKNVKITHGARVFEYFKEAYSFEDIINILDGKKSIDDKIFSNMSDLLFTVSKFNFRRGIIVGSGHGHLLNQLNGWKGEITYVDYAYRQLPGDICRDISDEEHADRIKQYLMNRRNYSFKIDFLVMFDDLEKYLYSHKYDFIILDVLDTSCNNVTKMLNIFDNYLNLGGLCLGFGHIPCLEESNCYLTTYGLINETKFLGIFGARLAVETFCREKGYIFRRTLDNTYYNWWYFFKE